MSSLIYTKIPLAPVFIRVLYPSSCEFKLRAKVSDEREGKIYSNSTFAPLPPPQTMIAANFRLRVFPSDLSDGYSVSVTNQPR